MSKKTTLMIAMLVMAVLVWAQPQSKPAPTKSDVGRFQIFNQPSTNDMFGGTYLVDTTTGKVWRRINLEDADGDDNGLTGEPQLLVPMTRLDSQNELIAFSLRHPKTEKK